MRNSIRLIDILFIQILGNIVSYLRGEDTLRTLIVLSDNFKELANIDYMRKCWEDEKSTTLNQINGWNMEETQRKWIIVTIDKSPKIWKNLVRTSFQKKLIRYHIQMNLDNSLERSLVYKGSWNQPWDIYTLPKRFVS